MPKHLPRGRRPGQPAYSADLAAAAIKKTRAGTVRHAILANRIAHKDQSRNAQAKRLMVNFMTLSEAEDGNRWPQHSAGRILRMALGVAESAS